jgi:hypothetical protein
MDFLLSFKNGCMRTSTQSTTNEDDETSISIADVPTWEDVIRLSNEVGDIAGGRTSSQLIGQKCAAAVRVTAGTGLRLCELLAVTAKRVDLKNGFMIYPDIPVKIPTEGSEFFSGIF